MGIVQAVTLGFIQGITEFLPISSSAHLIIVPEIFGWQDQGVVFDLTVHIGTLLAVVLYFRQKLRSIATAFFFKPKTAEYRLAWFIVFSTIPAGAVGLLLNTNRQPAFIIGINLIVWGILLGAADWYSRRQAAKGVPLADVNHLSVWQVVVLSLTQALALMPGTSRSGVTMTAGLFSKLSRTAAAEFSFLMSIPIIALAGMSKAYEVWQGSVSVSSWTPLGIGFLVSFVSGFLAIAFLMKIIQRFSFWPFVAYRVMVGIVILVIFS